MSPLDLIRGTDGRMVLTKLQAATFHLLLALTVSSVTGVRIYRYLKSGEPPTGGELLFDFAMWSLYAGAAIGHAVIDKTGAQINAFQNRKLDAAMPEPSVTSTTTTTEIRP